MATTKEKKAIKEARPNFPHAATIHIHHHRKINRIEKILRRLNGETIQPRVNNGGGKGEYGRGGRKGHGNRMGGWGVGMRWEDRA